MRYPHKNKHEPILRYDRFLFLRDMKNIPFLPQNCWRYAVFALVQKAKKVGRKRGLLGGLKNIVWQGVSSLLELHLRIPLIAWCAVGRAAYVATLPIDHSWAMLCCSYQGVSTQASYALASWKLKDENLRKKVPKPRRSHSPIASKHFVANVASGGKP